MYISRISKASHLVFQIVTFPSEFCGRARNSGDYVCDYWKFIFLFVYYSYITDCECKFISPFLHVVWICAQGSFLFSSIFEKSTMGLSSNSLICWSKPWISCLIVSPSIYEKVCGKKSLLGLCDWCQGFYLAIVLISCLNVYCALWMSWAILHPLYHMNWLGSNFYMKHDIEYFVFNISFCSSASIIWAATTFYPFTQIHCSPPNSNGNKSYQTIVLFVCQILKSSMVKGFRD